jgi:3-oxoacyl-[acyl-carrier protein] reductase
MSQTDQKVALVTGASRGIGSAIATSLAQRGMMVVGTATSEQGAASISAHLSEWGGVGRCSMSPIPIRSRRA